MAAGGDSQQDTAPFISKGEESFLIDNSNGAEFFSYFSSLRQNNCVSDFTLTCCGQTFPVHRVILMANSDHFRRMWSKRSSTPSTTNYDVNADPHLLGLVLDYLYTGKLCVAINRVSDVEFVARELMIPKLVNECARARLSGLVVTAENCLEMWSVGEAVGDQSMMGQAKAVAMRSLESVQDTPAFFALPYTCLVELVSSKDLVIQSNNERLLAALEWIRRNRSRKIHLVPILKVLPLSGMDRAYLRQCRYDPCVSGNEEAKSVLLEAATASRGSVTRTDHSLPLGRPLETFISVAGSLVCKDQEWVPDNRRVCLIPSSLNGPLRSLPDLPLSVPKLARVASCLSPSSAGSTLLLSGVGHINDEVWGINVEDASSVWTLRVRLSYGRWMHSMVFLKGNVYIVGGRDSKTGSCRSEVEAIDIDTSVCRQVGIVWGNTQARTYCQVVRQSDLLILMAQHPAYPTSDLVHVYNTDTNQVKSSIRMPSTSGECLCGMLVSGNSVIILGYAASYICPLEAVYQSDSSRVQKLSARYKTPNIWSAVVPSEDKQSILLIGGCHGDDDDAHPLYKASLRDVMSDSPAGWQRLPCSWPLGNKFLYSFSCCRVTVPVSR